jgi:hypothetical protein
MALARVNQLVFRAPQPKKNIDAPALLRLDVTRVHSHPVFRGVPPCKREL